MESRKSESYVMCSMQAMPCYAQCIYTLRHAPGTGLQEFFGETTWDKCKDLSQLIPFHMPANFPMRMHRIRVEAAMALGCTAGASTAWSGLEHLLKHYRNRIFDEKFGLPRPWQFADLADHYVDQVRTDAGHVLRCDYALDSFMPSGELEQQITAFLLCQLSVCVIFCFFAYICSHLGGRIACSLLCTYGVIQAAFAAQRSDERAHF